MIDMTRNDRAALGTRTIAGQYDWVKRKTESR